MPIKNTQPRKKSRAGCRNCKLRKVKCDEARPQCRKCETYGVVCNYNRTVSDLRLSSEQLPEWRVQGSPVSMTTVTPESPETPRTPVGTQLNGLLKLPALICPLGTTFSCADKTASIVLDGECVEHIQQFRQYIAGTLGGVVMQELFETRILDIAFSSPLLMHAILGVALLHRRYRRSPTIKFRPYNEVYHWSRCTTLLNRKLLNPIQPEDCDLLWATATYLGVIAFSSLDGYTPEEAWPLRQESDPSDLDWLRMSLGKMALWDLTDPLRPGSVFSPMWEFYAELHASMPSWIGGMPPELRHLCHLHDKSTPDNNPYYTAVQSLVRLARFPRDEVTLPSALAFLSHIDTRFKTLLEQKEPVALLLLALWYAAAGHAVWWIEQRALVEGRAICMYLERCHGDKPAILDLLPWTPSTAFQEFSA